MQRGSTLIEVLVAVGVSAMLTALVVVYGSGGRKTTSLYVDTVKLAQTILRAKSQAVLIYYNPTNPVCGYGMRFFNDSQPAYALFRYAAAEGESCDSIPVVDDTHYVEIQRFPLAAGISFGASTTVDTILFVPPDPQTLLWKGVDHVRSSGAIELQVGSSTMKRSVTITTSGQIGY
jgi:hypothetical protein